MLGCLSQFGHLFKRKKQETSSSRTELRGGSPTQFSNVNRICVTPVEENTFFSSEELCLLEKFGRFQNKFNELFRIGFPALFTLGVCPATIFMYDPIVYVLWPEDIWGHRRPKVNDVIACFLSPAGLIYAISFGFAFQEALVKQATITGK